MNRGMAHPSVVIGSKISRVLKEATGADLETDLPTFRFLIHLSNGVMLEFFPGEIRQSNYLTVEDAANNESIDEQLSIVGEEIVGVATFMFGTSSASSNEKVNTPPHHSADGLYDVPRHVALILSSGRVIINMYMCGGVSELHVGSVEGLTKHFAKPWRDYWTDEILERNKLTIVAR